MKRYMFRSANGLIFSLCIVWSGAANAAEQFCDLALLPNQAVVRHSLTAADLGRATAFDANSPSYSYELGIAADNWGRSNGFATAFPTFVVATENGSARYEIYGLKQPWQTGAWPSENDLGTMGLDSDRMRSLDRYAQRNGYVSSWPNWVQVRDQQSGLTNFGVYLMKRLPDAVPNGTSPVVRHSESIPTGSFKDQMQWAQNWLKRSTFKRQYSVAIVASSFDPWFGKEQPTDLPPAQQHAADFHQHGKKVRYGFNLLGYNILRMHPIELQQNGITSSSAAPIFDVSTFGERIGRDYHITGDQYAVPDQFEYSKARYLAGDIRTEVFFSEYERSKSYSANLGFGAGAGAEDAAKVGSETSGEYNRTESENGSTETAYVYATKAKTWYWLTLVKRQAKLHRDFQNDVLRLQGQPYERYKNFFAQRGTHYVLGALYGGRAYQEAQSRLDTYGSALSEGFSVEREETAEVSGVELSRKAGFGMQSETSNQRSSGLATVKIRASGGRGSTFGDWTVEEEDDLVPVKLVLRPMSELLVAEYFEGHESAVAQIRSEMEAHYAHYLNDVSIAGPRVPRTYEMELTQWKINDENEPKGPEVYGSIHFGFFNPPELQKLNFDVYEFDRNFVEVQLKNEGYTHYHHPQDRFPVEWRLPPAFQQSHVSSRNHRGVVPDNPLASVMSGIAAGPAWSPKLKNSCAWFLPEDQKFQSAGRHVNNRFQTPNGKNPTRRITLFAQKDLTTNQWNYDDTIRGYIKVAMKDHDPTKLDADEKYYGIALSPSVRQIEGHNDKAFLWAARFQQTNDNAEGWKPLEDQEVVVDCRLRRVDPTLTTYPDNVLPPFPFDN